MQCPSSELCRLAVQVVCRLATLNIRVEWVQVTGRAGRREARVSGQLHAGLVQCLFGAVDARARRQGRSVVRREFGSVDGQVTGLVSLGRVVLGSHRDGIASKQRVSGSRELCRSRLRRDVSNVNSDEWPNEGMMDREWFSNTSRRCSESRGRREK